MKNVKGFTLLSLTLMLPLFLGVISTLVVFSKYLLLQNTQQKQCFELMYQYQNSIAKQMQSLVRMNPKASQLRLQRRRAEMALKSALRTGNPILITGATSALAKIRLQQFQFRQTQLIILNKVRSLKSSYRVKMTRFHNKHSRRLFNPLGFSLNSWPQRSDSPSYKPDLDFEKKQASWSLWTTNLGHLFPTWAKKFLTKVPLKLHNKCAVTLREIGDNSWHPEPTKVKSSLSWW